MINISYKDPRPIYKQVKDGLRRLVVTGCMPPGEKLPSVRELATQLAANPNTIMRAYQELESEGYIYSIAGKGSFAAEKSDVRDARKSGLLVAFRDAVEELCYLGLPSAELVREIDSIYNSTGGKN